MRPTLTLATAAGCLLMGSTACTEVRPTPNVIFISLDTLRADHVSAYGYERKTTPHLDAFAQESVRFEDAIIQDAWTLTSHVSMLTSLYPDVHRAEARTLAPDLPLLPRILRERGYETAAVLDPELRYFQRLIGPHFDDFRLSRLTEAQGMSELEEWLKERAHRASDAPLFLLLHSFEIHADYRRLPYESPRRFRERYCPDCRATLRRCPRPKACGARFLASVDHAGIELDAELLVQIRALYDAGIRHTDEEIGRLFALLRALDLYDESLIIVTSDHGEEFQEHGRMLHSQAYDELLRVPLMIRFPGAAHAGQVVRDPVQSIDLMPTVLEFIGAPLPAVLQGQSLLGVLDGDIRDRDRPAFAIGRHQGGGRRTTAAVRSGEWKLIVDLDSDRSELYHLESDPGEQHDVSGQAHAEEHERSLRSALAAQTIANEHLAAALQTIDPTEGQTRDVDWSDGDRERLRDLGYAVD